MQQKILLVDDREDNLFSMETILEADEYAIVKANSGRQALKILLAEFDFALILQEKRLIAINKSLQNEINDRKASEQKIIDLNKQLLNNIDGLEKANKDLDRFAFMASHDLQEPLRKIRTFSDRLYLKYKDQL